MRQAGRCPAMAETEAQGAAARAQGAAMRIAHLADIHIADRRREEYAAVFRALYQSLRETAPDLVVVAGDVFDNKMRASPHNIQDVLTFLTELTRVAPVVMIAGNHDTNVLSPGALDLLTPILAEHKHLQPPYLTYWRDSGHYEAHGCRWTVKATDGAWPPPLPAAAAALPHVLLFHEEVDAARLPNGGRAGFGLALTDLAPYDLALGGHIHERQLLSPRAGYCGSLVQQNIGESHDRHGYLLWEPAPAPAAAGRPTWRPREVDVYNARGYLTVRLRGGEDVTARPLPLDPLYWALSFDARTEPAAVDKAVADYTALLGRPPRSVEGGSPPAGGEGAEGEEGGEGAPPAVLPGALQQAQQAAGRLEEHETIIRALLGDSPLLEEVLELHRLHFGQHTAGAGGRVRLLRVEFENLYRYGLRNVIDFQRLEGRVSGVVAPNFAGKSGLIEVLLFALYDRHPRSRSKKEIVHKMAGSCRLALDFSIDGRPGRIEKGHQGGGKDGPSQYRLWFDGEDRSGGGTAECLRNIAALVGDPDIALATSFQLQDAGSEFVGAEPQGRKKLMASVLALGRFEDIEKAVTAQLSGLNGELRAVQAAYRGTPLDALLEEEQGLRLRLEQLQQGRRQAEERAALARAALREATEARVALPPPAGAPPPAAQWPDWERAAARRPAPPDGAPGADAGDPLPPLPELEDAPWAPWEELEAAAAAEEAAAAAEEARQATARQAAARQAAAAEAAADRLGICRAREAELRARRERLDREPAPAPADAADAPDAQEVELAALLPAADWAGWAAVGAPGGAPDGAPDGAPAGAPPAGPAALRDALRLLGDAAPDPPAALAEAAARWQLHPADVRAKVEQAARQGPAGEALLDKLRAGARPLELVTAALEQARARDEARRLVGQICAVPFRADCPACLQVRQVVGLAGEPGQPGAAAATDTQGALAAAQKALQVAQIAAALGDFRAWRALEGREGARQLARRLRAWLAGRAARRAERRAGAERAAQARRAERAQLGAQLEAAEREAAALREELAAAPAPPPAPPTGPAAGRPAARRLGRCRQAARLLGWGAARAARQAACQAADAALQGARQEEQAAAALAAELVRGEAQCAGRLEVCAAAARAEAERAERQRAAAHQVALLDCYRQVIRPKGGIADVLLSRARAALERGLNDTLRGLGAHAFEVALGADYALQHRERKGHAAAPWLDVRLASGYQKFVLGLAARLLMWRGSAVALPDALFLDEGFGACDEENLLAAGEALELLAGGATGRAPRLLFLVSHLDALKGRIESPLHIEVGEVYSRVSNGEERGLRREPAQAVVRAPAALPPMPALPADGDFSPQQRPDGTYWCPACDKAYKAGRVATHVGTKTHAEAIRIKLKKLRL